MSSLLMLLDGIQPVGVTTFVLDQNNLVASLGAAAEINTLLPQESGVGLEFGIFGRAVACNRESHRIAPWILFVGQGGRVLSKS